MSPFRRRPGPAAPATTAARQSRRKLEPVVPTDELVELRRQLGEGDWEPTAEHLAGLQHPDDRSVAASYLSRGPAARFDAWTMAQPDSGLAWFVLGMHQLNAAWMARTAQRASKVSESGFAQFHALLRDAEISYGKAIRLDQNDPLPWAAMIRSGMGLGVDLAELRSRFMEAQRIQPGTAHAHMSMLTALCHKWGGSHEEMFTFARWAHGALPEGSGARVVLTAAHFERWMFHAEFEEAGMAQANAYYYDQTVQAELDDVYAHSVDSPVYVETLHSLVERNYALFGHIRGGRRPEAAALLAVIGDRFPEIPMSWLPGGPDAACAAFR